MVIQGNTIVKTECDRGIGPILRLYESGVLKNAFVVDKIIGKAAAMVLTQAGVTGCYGITMSKTALQWLKNHGIVAEYETCVDAIINRAGNGICPMEETVKDSSDAGEAFLLLKRKMEEL